MEDYSYECPICREEYTIAIKPKILQCGHSFHEECLEMVYKTSRKCPLCEVDFTLETIPDHSAQSPIKLTHKSELNGTYPQLGYDLYYTNSNGAPNFRSNFSYISQPTMKSLEDDFMSQWESYPSDPTSPWGLGITSEPPSHFLNTDPFTSNLYTQDRKNTPFTANTKMKELSEYMVELEASKKNIKKCCAYANEITTESKAQICLKIQAAKRFLQEMEEKCVKNTENYIMINKSAEKKCIAEIDDKMKLIHRCLASLEKVISSSSGINASLQAELNQLASKVIPGANVEFYSYNYDPEWTLDNEPSFKIGRLDSQQMPSSHISNPNSQPSGSVSPISKYTPKHSKKGSNYEWYTVDNDKGSRRAGPVIEKQIEKGYKKGAKTWRIHHKDHGEYFAIVNYEDRTFKYFSTNKVFKLERTPSY
ncbi:unnamed protein product [Blepharisma stoltei]|uniref:RING-type domain-containing protein n=1 Tax=Blepharisma stoltei TaxID=1481888 RepID=A0AAU9IQ16_9CILI|nr:unnamed protein product [Blepharisma stoltei]